MRYSSYTLERAGLCKTWPLYDPRELGYIRYDILLERDLSSDS